MFHLQCLTLSALLIPNQVSFFTIQLNHSIVLIMQNVKQSITYCKTMKKQIGVEEKMVWGFSIAEQSERKLNWQTKAYFQKNFKRIGF